MTIAENIGLVRGYPRRSGMIDWRALRERARRALGLIGSSLDPELTVAQGVCNRALIFRYGAIVDEAIGALRTRKSNETELAEAKCSTLACLSLKQVHFGRIGKTVAWYTNKFSATSISKGIGMFCRRAGPSGRNLVPTRQELAANANSAAVLPERFGPRALALQILTK